MSTVSSIASFSSPPLTPRSAPRSRNGDNKGKDLWETDLDQHVDVCEEMRETQRRINVWIELWKSLQKQLGDRPALLQSLNEAKENIKMLEANLRKLESQNQDLQLEMGAQKGTLAALQNSNEDARKENLGLESQLKEKNNVITKLVHGVEKFKRRNYILNHVKQKMMDLLKENQTPAFIQAKGLAIVLREIGSMADLKNCRRVSKSWNAISTPVLREKSAQIDFADNLMLDKFLRVMESNEDGNIPTCDYKFDDSILYPGNEERINYFLQKCGPTMTQLSLIAPEGFINTLTVHEENLPEFSSLTILFVLITNGRSDNMVVQSSSSSSAYRRRSSLQTNFLPTLVRLSPNLQKFSLIIAPSTDTIMKKRNKYDRLLLDTFRELSDTLSFLEVDSQLSDSHLQALLTNPSTVRSRSRNLRDIQLSLKESPDLSSVGLGTFLASQGETLENLKIIYDEPTGKMTFEFPPLPQLKFLTLKGFHSKDCFAPIDYGECFPSLEKFYLTCANDEPSNEWNGLFPSENNSDISPATSVQEMMLTLTRFDCVSYHRVGRIFPMVKKLRLVVPFTAPEVQESLWCALPLLEDLELHLPVGSPTSVDELFTGIPSERCHKILQNRTFFDVAVDKIRKRPSLTHLKSLRRLKLDLKAHLITDVTGFLAFLQLKNLKTLEITYDADFGITSECLRVLRQRFELFCRRR